MNTLIQEIASTLVARTNCDESGNSEWEQKWEARLVAIESECLPDGCGFDNGTTIDRDTNGKSVVFKTSFHHMNQLGYYDGWTEHLVVVTPAFDGFDIKVRGRNRNGIKEYISDVFSEALGAKPEHIRI